MQEQMNHWSIAILKSSWANVGNSLIRTQGLVIILHGIWFYLLGSWFFPLSHSSFCMKDSPCLQLHSLHRLHPTSWILGVRRYFFILYCLWFFQSKQCSLEQSFKNVYLLWIFLGFTLLNKSHPHKALQDKFFSILALCWGTMPLNFLEFYCLIERIHESHS